MGTQFSSRISPSDSKRILRRLQQARASIGRPKGRPQKRGAAISGIARGMSAEQARQLGKATISEILDVANTHDFFDEFEQSTLFDEALDWLKQLRNDAHFNGFSGIIKQYDLDQSSNPVAELGRRLEDLKKQSAEQKQDPFKQPVILAAKAVLVEVITKTDPQSSSSSGAKAFGKALAAFDLRDLVARYIGSFIYEFAASIINRADPEQNHRIVREALSVSASTTKSIASRAVSKVKREGKLGDTSRIKRIVRQELERFVIKDRESIPAS